MPSDDACRSFAERATIVEEGSAVIAIPEQVLAGYPVGLRHETAICSSCGSPLHETDIAFAYGYRPVETADWTVPRLYCHGCVPSRIRSPTLGTTEVLVGGRLGTITLPTSRTHRHCLTELALRAVSPPTEGTDP